MAGHEIIWANDLYEDAVETYRHNLGIILFAKIYPKLMLKKFQNVILSSVAFLVQGFSVANMKRHETDERNALYKQLIRIIDAKKPKFFLAENVKGLTNLAKGTVFQMILSDFSSLGYKVSYRVLNAADYGVPQTRQRVIIIGVRNDIDFEYIFPNPTNSQDGGMVCRKWVSVGKRCQLFLILIFQIICLIMIIRNTNCILTVILDIEL